MLSASPHRVVTSLLVVGLGFWFSADPAHAQQNGRCLVNANGQNGTTLLATQNAAQLQALRRQQVAQALQLHALLLQNAQLNQLQLQQLAVLLQNAQLGQLQLQQLQNALNSVQQQNGTNLNGQPAVRVRNTSTRPPG
jgi:hypothetical protein